MDTSRKHYLFWELGSWGTMLVLFCYFLYWLWNTPSIGKAGVALAVGAAIMPVFWERISTFAKVTWILMMFLLLVVENRAIDKEHADQIQAIKDVGTSFKSVLDSQQTGFKTLTEQNQANFKTLIDDERINFSHMMDRYLAAQRLDTAHFSTLLTQERQLLNDQKELYDFASDRLVPASDPSPASQCKADTPDDVFVFLGTRGNTAVTSRFPNTILRVRDHDVVTIDRGDAGSLILSIDMRDASGRMIASLSNKGFLVSKNYELYLARPDKSTVIIQDGYENEILKARFLNPSAFSVQGQVQYLDAVVSLDIPNMTDVCLKNAGRAEINIR